MTTRTRKIAVIHELVRAGDLKRLRRAVARFDDVQLASQLDNLDAAEQKQVMQILALERRAPVLGAMRYEAAAQIVAELAPEEAARLLGDLESDDAADILGRIDEGLLRQILSRLDQENAEQIEDLLAYEANSAGGIMSPAACRVHPDDSVATAISTLQGSEELPAHPFYVYVVDAEERLVGVCSLRMLVTRKPDVRVGDLMRTELVTVTAETDQEEVADMVGRYDLLAIPVVDAQFRLLGVVEVDDIVDVLREEATEDILKMAGAGAKLVDARSFVSSLRVRWRWLMAAALGGMAAAFGLSRYEGVLGTVPALAFFMPVVAGMGGNVGTQSSTIVVRGLAVGFVEAERLRRVVVREISLGASLGVLYGVLVAGLAPWVAGPDTDPMRLAIVVALGTLGSMTIAAAVGTCAPLMLDRYGIDPAVATGPFVTTAVDVVGLLIYFWMAAIFLGVHA